MKTKSIFLSLFLISSLSIISCKDEEIEEENELITTVKLKFTANGTNQTFAWKDLDGDGGNAPTKENVVLKPNTTYTLAVEFLDESQSPAGDITAEIKKEQDEHLVVFTPSPSSLFTYTYGDKDSRSFPVGLTGTLKTNTAGVGTIKIQLRHQPPAGTSPTKNGTATVGSDDINIDLNMEVK